MSTGSAIFIRQDADKKKMSAFQDEDVPIIRDGVSMGRRNGYTSGMLSNGHLAVSLFHLVMYAVVFGLLAGGAGKDFFDNVDVTYTVGGLVRDYWTGGLGITGVVALVVWIVIAMGVSLKACDGVVDAVTPSGGRFKHTAVLFLAYGVADALALISILPFVGMNDLFVLIASCVIVVTSQSYFGVVSSTPLQRGHPDNNLLFIAGIAQTIPYAMMFVNLIENHGKAHELNGADSDAMISTAVMIWASIKVIMTWLTVYWVHTDPEAQNVQVVRIDLPTLDQLQLQRTRMVRVIAAGTMFFALVSFSILYAFPDTLDETWAPLFWVSSAQVLDSWVWPVCQCMPFTAAGVLFIIWTAQWVGIHFGIPIFGTADVQKNTGNDAAGIAAWSIASIAVMIQLCSVANVNHLTELVIYCALLAIGIVLHGTVSPVRGESARGASEDPIALVLKATFAMAPLVLVTIKFYYGPDGDIGTTTQLYVWSVFVVYIVYFAADTLMRTRLAITGTTVANRMVISTIMQFLAVLATAGFAYSGVCMSENKATQYQQAVVFLTSGISPK